MWEILLEHELKNRMRHHSITYLRTRGESVIWSVKSLIIILRFTVWKVFRIPAYYTCLIYAYQYFLIFNLEDQRLWELSQGVVSQNPLAGQSTFYLLFVFNIGNEESIPCALAASTERTINLLRPGRCVVLIIGWMAGVARLPLTFWRQVPSVKVCQWLGLRTVRQPRSGRGSHCWRPCSFHAELCYVTLGVCQGNYRHFYLLFYP